MLHFELPDGELRRKLMDRWHADVRAGIDLDRAVEETTDYSFAEVEELKNLLILRFIDVKEWDWSWASTNSGVTAWISRRKSAGWFQHSRADHEWAQLIGDNPIGYLPSPGIVV